MNESSGTVYHCGTCGMTVSQDQSPRMSWESRPATGHGLARRIGTVRRLQRLWCVGGRWADALLVVCPESRPDDTDTLTITQETLSMSSGDSLSKHPSTSGPS
jgi:hypothetical protein